MILYKSENTNKETLYRLMRSNDVKKATECIGLTGKPTDYVIYESGDAKITAVRLEDGTMFATNSETLRNEVEALIDIFGELPPIKIVSGTSKSGRTYVTVGLA